MHLVDDARLWTLVPLAAIFLLFIVAVPVFALAVWPRRARDEDRVERRRSLIGPFLSYFLLWMISPIERRLVAARVSPNALTAFSLSLSLAAAVALAAGRYGLGGWLYLFNGIADLFDGRVARATNRVTVEGAFADSVADRVAESLVFGGLAYHLRGAAGGTPLVLVVAALAGSFLVSYTRARGEGLGVTGVDIGAMQRPERTLFLGVGIAASPILEYLWPEVFTLPWSALAAITLIAVSSLITAAQRFAHVYRALRDGTQIPAPEPRRASSPPVTEARGEPRAEPALAEPPAAAIAPRR